MSTTDYRIRFPRFLRLSSSSSVLFGNQLMYVGICLLIQAHLLVNGQEYPYSGDLYIQKFWSEPNYTIPVLEGRYVSIRCLRNVPSLQKVQFLHNGRWVGEDCEISNEYRRLNFTFECDGVSYASTREFRLVSQSARLAHAGTWTCKYGTQERQDFYLIVHAAANLPSDMKINTLTPVSSSSQTDLTTSPYKVAYNASFVLQIESSCGYPAPSIVWSANNKFHRLTVPSNRTLLNETIPCNGETRKYKSTSHVMFSCESWRQYGLVSIHGHLHQWGLTGRYDVKLPMKSVHLLCPVPNELPEFLRKSETTAVVVGSVVLTVVVVLLLIICVYYEYRSCVHHRGRGNKPQRFEIVL